MGLPDKFLKEDEDVVLDLHPHWWVFVKPALVVLLALALAVASAVTGFGTQYAKYACLVLALVGLVWLIGRYAKWATTNFVLTTHRIVVRSGVLAKHSREIPLDRVNDISTTQSLFERMMGAGDVVIESAGERGQDAITALPHPFRVQNEIYSAIEKAGIRTAGLVHGERALTIPEQLEKLDDLRQRGVISQQEFDVKKSQLLDRM